MELRAIVLQVKSWWALQASHLLEGPPYLQRNFNPLFLTLENWLANQARHSCSGRMMDELVGGFLRPYNSTAAQNCLTGGDIIPLADMMAKEVRALKSNGSDRQMDRLCICTYYPENRCSI